MAGSCPPVFDRAIGPAASASRSNCAVLRGETTFPQVARLAGFEPATGCLEGSCSVQLSYRRPEFIVHDQGHALDTVVANPAVAAGPAGTGPAGAGLRAGPGRAYRRDP
jgi:hypothetical protein